MNQSIFQALRLERLVMFITIGLIVIVAALNIVATLIMMVLEKTRDIAILMSMGATPDEHPANLHSAGRDYRRYRDGLSEWFLGTSISYFADKYHLISLAPDVYTIAYVPFKAQSLDSVIIAAVGDFDQFPGHALSLGRRGEAPTGGSVAV